MGLRPLPVPLLRPIVVVVIGVIGVTGLSRARAQEPTLAELAARERARRATVREPARVYTNADLSSAGRLTVLRPGADRAESVEEAWGRDLTVDDDAGRPHATDGEPDIDERLAAAREQRRRSALHAAAIQNRIDGLWAAFTARDDPAQRAQLQRERTEALAELEQLRAELERLDEDVRSLEDETRRQP